MKRLFCLLALAGVALNHGCRFKDDINTDPNNPRVVQSPATLLTSSQVGFAYAYGGAYARYAGLYTNQFSGIDRQPISLDNFNFLPSETDDAWDASYRTLLNLNALIQRSPGSPYYIGPAQVMKALVLGTLASNFGQVPYRTALRASEDGTGLQPTYDSGPTNYADVQALLDSGIANMAAPRSILAPGPNDNLFAGDLTQWTKFAYALKARYYMHTAKVNPGDYALAQAAAQQAAGVTARVVFPGNSVGNQGPLYQYGTQRGDIGAGRLLTDTLRFLQDPRFVLYVTDTGGNGSNPGQADGFNASEDDFVYPNVSNPESVYFVNVSEPYFILAEVAMRQGNTGIAASNYNTAVRASLIERGVADTVFTEFDSPEDSATKVYRRNYFRRVLVETGSTITLNKIMVQKWLALYANPETFADWRRTGIPATRLPDANVTGGRFVRKFPYPQKERTLNAANVPTYEPANAPQTGRVWWDVP